MPTNEAIKTLADKTWWSTADVAAYLGHCRGRPCSYNAAKIWMHRAAVRRCATDRRLTCKQFVDAALNRKGG